MEIVIQNGFGALSLICKLQIEFAHNRGGIKAVLDQLNATIIDFWVYECFSLIVVFFIICLSFYGKIFVFRMEKIENPYTHEMNLHS